MVPATYCRTRVRPALLFLLLSIILASAGCSYGGFYVHQTHWRQTFEYLPSMSALNKLSPEDSLVLAGPIVKLQKRQEPLLLVAVSSQYRKNEKVAVVQLQSDTYYMAFLPKGDYQLYIFADLNKNKDFENDELIGKASMTVSAEYAKGGALVEGPTISLDFEHPGKAEIRLSETVRPTSYVYKSLDDEFFDPKYGTMGLYNPADLMAHTQGFVFGLEAYDEKKTSVLFVHGISGTPRDWKFIVEGMDRSRFQPFFFYYPSGLHLDKLGSVLAQTIASIDKVEKQKEPRFVLVAHSMGGLISLAAINKLAAERMPASLKMYCSIATPYGGDESARKWIDNAPFVVASWRDIAAPNEFLTEVTSKPFPKQLPFYLYFSYSDTSKFKLGESSDGTVTLRSQLVPSLQTAATKVLGFNETHEGILNSKETRASFLKLLDAITPYQPAEKRENGNGIGH